MVCSFIRLRLSFRTGNQQQGLSRGLILLSLPLLLVVLMVVTAVVVVEVPSRIELPHKTPTFKLVESAEEKRNNTPSSEFQVHRKANETLKSTHDYQYSSPVKNKDNTRNSSSAAKALPPPPQTRTTGVKDDNSRESGHDIDPGVGPYHNWELFDADYQEMLRNLKIFVYPDAFMNNESSSSSSADFAGIFLPYSNPSNPKLGNYFSEHAFKVALLRSSLITQRPEEANFFFMPFSINAMRNDPRLRSDSSIPNFIAQYTTRISSQFKFWNASRGADHFYVCCHSVGRLAASKHRDLHNNAIQVTCSSSYFQRLYISHKDVGLPQVWPRNQEQVLNLPDARSKLVFFAGRIQNSRTRQDLLALWGNDTLLDIFFGHSPFSYEEGFRQSKYCLHVKGYEVNTARVSDAIHYGCIPVLISNYYDLPFANVLDWSKFSIVISEGDIGSLKKILLSIPRQTYLNMYQNLCLVRRHFIWHTTTPRKYDSFYMTAYQLWLRRGLHQLKH